MSGRDDCGRGPEGSADYDWSLCATLLALARRGTIAGAARELGQSHPTVRRRLDRLEDIVGGPLFARSQDGVRPTPLAERLMPHAERAEAAAGAMLRAASWERSAGLVRLAAGRLLGTELLPDVLAGARASHPGMRFELALADDADAVLRLGADVSLTTSRPEREGLVATRVGRLATGLFVRASEVERRGVPRDVDDLVARFGLIGPCAMASGTRHPADPALVTTDELAALSGIVAGLGAGWLPLAVGGRRAGLARVLPELRSELDLWVSMHPDLRRASQVRLLLDALRAHARGLGAVEGGSGADGVDVPSS